ncbi:MAG: hypothetical protein U0R81_09420 [Mycobacterium sp.]
MRPNEHLSGKRCELFFDFEGDPLWTANGSPDRLLKPGAFLSLTQAPGAP